MISGCTKSTKTNESISWLSRSVAIMDSQTTKAPDGWLLCKWYSNYHWKLLSRFNCYLKPDPDSQMLCTIIGCVHFKEDVFICARFSTSSRILKSLYRKDHCGWEACKNLHDQLNLTPASEQEYKSPNESWKNDQERRKKKKETEIPLDVSSRF